MATASKPPILGSQANAIAAKLFPGNFMPPPPKLVGTGFTSNNYPGGLDAYNAAATTPMIAPYSSQNLLTGQGMPNIPPLQVGTGITNANPNYNALTTTPLAYANLLGPGTTGQSTGTTMLGQGQPFTGGVYHAAGEGLGGIQLTGGGSAGGGSGGTPGGGLTGHFGSGGGMITGSGGVHPGALGGMFTGVPPAGKQPGLQGLAAALGK